MKADLESQIEDDFEFDAFNRFSQTREAVVDAEGSILYFPTDVPVPFDKRVLSTLVDRDDVRVLSMPTDQWEFRDRIYTGLEYLVDQDGEATVVFFCPRALVDAYDDLPGNDFVAFEPAKLVDPIRTRRQVFEQATGTPLSDDSIAELATFVLHLVTTAATGAELAPSHVETSEDQIDEFYIPFTNLETVHANVRDFFLESLGVTNLELFDDLSVTAQENVYLALLLEKYGERFAVNEPRHDISTVLAEADDPIIQLFRRLVVKWVVQDRLFDATLEEVAEIDMDRPFIEDVQDVYRDIVDSDDSINTQDPSDAAAALVDHFGLLFQDVDSEELESLVATARDQLSVYSQQIEAYRPERALETVERVDRFLQLLSEVALIRRPRFVNAALPPDRWTHVFRAFVEVALEHRQEELLDYRYVTALNQARKSELREQAAEDRAAEIRDLPTNLDTLPTFLDEWCTFLAEQRAGEDHSNLLLQELIDKYDQFCDELVSQYEDIVTGNDRLHLSDFLPTEPGDGVRIFIVIDSFGYTDYRLLQELDLLAAEPDTVGVMYSNLPSYTPSAMTTLLTGLPAETTGIYGWEPRHDGTVYNLRRSGYSTDDFAFTDVSSPNSFQLIQRAQMGTSGITMFAKSVANIRLSTDARVQGNNLDGLLDAFVGELEASFEERQRIATNDALSEAEREAALQEQKSDYVLYIEDFDQFLHETMALLEFENYYNALGNFIDALLGRLNDTVDEYLDEPADIIIGSDHGKLTRYEMELILNERPEYEFTQHMLPDAVDLDTAYLVNFRNADFTNRTGRYYLSVATPDTDPPIQHVRDLFDTEEDVSDNEILSVIEEVEYTMSGSKFAFGWTDDDVEAAHQRFQTINGLDTYLPQGTSVFDMPQIGILSRYDIKNRSSHDHGYHGGTSLSEMAGLRMTFPGGNDHA